MSRFWEFINQGDDSVELQIEGDIIDDDDAWLYEWFGYKATAKNAFKEELSKYKGQDIIVWIDSYGGNVFAAAGIYNALKEHNGKITVKIDGKAMSAASVIAMAGNEISISPVGVMMIHNPLTYAQGDSRVMRKTAEVLDVIKETLINSYRRSGKTDKELWKMLDDETWMSANVAVKEGFADNVLYEEEPLKVENLKEFSFNRLAVVNSANASLRKMLMLERENLIQDKGDDLVDFKTIEELKNAYPDLIKELEDSARLEERERIKGIEEISNSIDPKLVFKAKFEEPLNAEKLAFEALKADNQKGQKYLENRKKDVKSSGVEKIEVNATETDIDDQPKTIEDKAKNVAARFDSKRRGVVVDG